MRSSYLRCTLLFRLVIFSAIGAANPVLAQEIDLPDFLKDRGRGQPTSMFGTYINKGELLVYPFFEYYLDNDLEYKPSELGYGLEQDLFGKYRASEGLIFIGYGITDWLAIELEAAVIDASLERDPNDTSATPAKISESGTGDVEGQIRLRWFRENESRPELFSYFEAVSPQQKDKVLIGTPDWELKLGSGVIKGFSWGTMTARIAMEYSAAESKAELGEYAVEFIKRLSPTWRIYLGVEGTQDELGLINEVQLFLSRDIYLKLNNSVGITSKATDWAPEVGCMFIFPLGDSDAEW